MVLHHSRLSERDRRHYAALEAIKLGWGGTSYISRLLGVNRNTIMLGIKELNAEAARPQHHTLHPGRQRRPGGGRKKKDRAAGY